MIARAVLLSIRQLADPQTLRLLAITIAITLAIFAALGAGLWWAIAEWAIPRWFPASGGEYAVLAAAAIGIIALWFLFRSVAMLVIGLFTDAIVESVEEDHYPDAARTARTVSISAGLRLGLRSALRALGWNLLAAPAYLSLLVTGVGTLALALLINTILLGRDFEAMVAARHPGADAMTPRHRWALGLLSATAFLVPVVNLLAPVFGAALAVHLFHASKGQPA